MRILGIDPGSTSMGYAVIDTAGQEIRVVCHGTTRITCKDLSGKLQRIQQELEQLLKKYTPARAGVETLFFAKNKKTALEVAHARGVILVSLLNAGVPIVEFTPPQVKIAVANYGHADKRMVHKMVCAILGLQSIAGDDNAIDALAVAIAASRAPAQ